MDDRVLLLSNPFSFRYSVRRSNCFSGSMSGTSRKSNFATAFDGRTVFAPSPVYPAIKPQILHVGSPARAFLIS
jgi:hypothetical protein